MRILLLNTDFPPAFQVAVTGNPRLASRHACDTKCNREVARLLSGYAMVELCVFVSADITERKQCLLGATRAEDSLVFHLVKSLPPYSWALGELYLTEFYEQSGSCSLPLSGLDEAFAHGIWFDSPEIWRRRICSQPQIVNIKSGFLDEAQLSTRNPSPACSWKNLLPLPIPTPPSPFFRPS